MIEEYTLYFETPRGGLENFFRGHGRYDMIENTSYRLIKYPLLVFVKIKDIYLIYFEILDD